MTIPTNGLDFYLPFDADMDEKIHSLTGTLSSSSAATYFMLSSDTAVGKFLRCIKTQGSSSYYLKYPGSESLMQYGTGDFSLSFWMRAPDWGNFTHVVFEKKYNDNYDGFVVFKVLAPLNLCCRLRKGSGGDPVDILTASAANSDKFIHWCFIRDAGGGRWYCNGLQEATSGELINECIEGGCNVDPGRAIGVNVSNSEIFKIGYSASWPSKQSVFDLKALRIYNRALSDSEITELSQEFSGTSSLDTVLVALDGARDALVTAINAKGGSLADNATLYQCAETVGSLSAGGTSAEYYKCASVDTSAKTWSGYKAVFDSTAGTWSFESDVTAGLAYTSVTPVVGNIYSADALVIVSLLYTGTPTLTSPTGMTSGSSDEWEISASSYYSDKYPPWEAFDGVKGSDVDCWTGSNSASSWWLQWQNKKKQVLVQRLRIQGTGSGDIAQQAIKSFVLQGSNDGSTWLDICTASGLTWSSVGYEWKEFTFSNTKSYYYHRLANITATSFPTIVELETYDM